MKISAKQIAWNIAQGYRKEAEKVGEEIVRCVCIGTDQNTTKEEKDDALRRKRELLLKKEDLERKFDSALNEALKIA